MITSLILTVVVMVCFFVILQYVINPSPLDQNMKWGVTAIAALILVLIILSIWGVIPAADWHR